MAEAVYAEAKGEPTEGVIAVGNTVVRRIKHWKPKRSACQHILKAYQRKGVPKQLQGFYYLLARGLLNGEIADVTKGADSFIKKGRKVPGAITRAIAGHVFYIMPKPSGGLKVAALSRY